jgi:hypothetical protein
MEPNLSVALAVLAFVGLWIGASVLMARGNRATLAQSYRFTGTFHGKRWRRQDADVGSEQYWYGVTVGVNSDGVYLAMMWLGRAGHPPLFIPWSDISTTVQEGFLSTSMVFHFRPVPSVSLWMSESLGQRIAAAASWRSPVADVPSSRSAE